MSTPIRYTKLVGTGNDFVLIDAFRTTPRRNSDWPALAKRLCDSKTGEGTDGLLVLAPSRRADVRMRVFNPDGSEPTMCGNGIRCLAWYANASRAARTSMSIETGAGIKRARIRSRHRVRVDMGAPVFRRRWERFFEDRGRPVEADLVDSGVPHLVCWVRDPARVDVKAVGRRLRRDRRLGASGANVDFVRVLRARGSRATLAMRTFERGVEGETPACGTGSVAASAAFVHRLLGRWSGSPVARKRFTVTVRVPGGMLRVQVSAGCSAGGRVIFGPALLEGDARPVSSGWYPNGRSQGR